MSIDLCQQRLRTNSHTVVSPPDRADRSIVPGSRTVNIDRVAVELNISRRVAYELARKNQLPVPVIRIGERRMVVSRQALDDLLASPLRSISATDAA